MLTLAVMAAAALQTSASTAPQSSAPPNVLVILADDLGHGDLSCQGSVQIPTPNIDRLAAEGTRALRAHASSLVCAPSRAGLMTGRYQNRFGFEHNLSIPAHVKPEACGLPLDEPTMAERLKALGYRTAAVGKWHLGASPEHHPNARGFDSFFGMIKGSHGYFPAPQKHSIERDGEPVEEFRRPYLTDEFSLEATGFITAGADRAEPWFLYLAYNAPHTPLEATEADLARFAHVEPPRRRTYCAMVHALDRGVGEVLDALDATGQAGDTIVVFLNDNGGSCDASRAINAPLRGQKSMVLEGGTRVPFLVRWPGRVPAGAEYPHPVSALDLVPTFVAAAGGEITPRFAGRGERRRELPFDGVDLLPYLAGERDGRPHEQLFWRISQRGAAVLDGDWKLVRLPHRLPELYDLASDPSELRDLAPEQPERAEALLARLHEWECTFERNPMWESGVRWATYNRRLYDADYVLEQPAAPSSGGGD